jgi:hypothetical protein
MVRIARRLLLIVSLMFWQGGFTFYASVVVPVGAEVLGSHTEQGFVTRQVTNWLNVAGAVTLPILAWDLAVSADTASWRRWLRWSTWAVAVVSLGSLVFLHQRLDALLDPGKFLVLDSTTFRSHHSLYLWISTLQWAAALVYLAATLMAWRREDRAGAGPPQDRNSCLRALVFVSGVCSQN